jgi:ATP phosphoribosyltransferase-like protein
METILKIGMPAGSLADPNRGGNLVNLLANSGFSVSGYAQGGPTKFTSVNYLFGWDGRPQEFGSQLEINEIDVAIAGNDWVKERVLEMKLEYGKEVKLECVLPLNRGGVKLVGIVDDDRFDTVEDFLKNLCSQKRLITVVSEMPYMALDWLRTKLDVMGLLDRFQSFSVQKYKTPSKIESGIVIYETWGKTEAKIKNGGADIGLEITQSGSAIKNYGLKIIDTLMHSQTSIWINPEVRKDAEKLELLNMFLLNLYGSINAEGKMMVMFNVSNKNIDAIEQYLREKNLFADEPTVSQGKEFAVYNIQIDAGDKEEPLAKVRYELAKRGATSINTIPVQSSIPSLKVITDSAI